MSNCFGKGLVVFIVGGLVGAGIAYHCIKGKMDETSATQPVAAETTAAPVEAKSTVKEESTVPSMNETSHSNVAPSTDASQTPAN